MVNLLNEGDLSSFFKLLNQVDDDFSPTLSSRVDLEQYALKLLKVATVFGVYKKNQLVGAIAVYMNDLDSKVAYCPFIAILSNSRGQGFSQLLLEIAIAELKSKQFNSLSLTVRADSPASHLYKKVGFLIVNEFNYEDSNVKGLKMELKLL
ncbi:GNAT family N-acetyltransferase [Pseudoalteromonas sp. SR44-5]|uniref:GNAT family N-acetyltransferase n=1 Tax=Pseudoalteromonas sp. SR44-5 TaxID=2760934 RepID=UPI0015FFC535|nr:GNAT family N-acetyltransferase [Pseudoalteromonas sp. SR44-5]MBB1368460.1 GNAT family N-acetyltransferase [Pseudoalteromonas sp. SR44-5]